MEGIEFSHDDFGSSRFGIIGIAQMQQQIFERHTFVLSKRNNEKLFCDKCLKEFPAHISFFIIAINSTRELFCHPCNNKRIGIDPHEENKKLLSENNIQQKPVEIKPQDQLTLEF